MKDAVTVPKSLPMMIANIKARSGILYEEARRPVMGRTTLARVREQARVLMDQMQEIDAEFALLIESLEEEAA